MANSRCPDEKDQTLNQTLYFHPNEQKNYYSNFQTKNNFPFWTSSRKRKISNSKAGLASSDRTVHELPDHPLGSDLVVDGLRMDREVFLKEPAKAVAHAVALTEEKEDSLLAEGLGDFVAGLRLYVGRRRLRVGRRSSCRVVGGAATSLWRNPGIVSFALALEWRPCRQRKVPPRNGFHWDNVKETHRTDKRPFRSFPATYPAAKNDWTR